MSLVGLTLLIYDKTGVKYLAYEKKQCVCEFVCKKHPEFGSSATVERAISCSSYIVHHFRILMSSQVVLSQPSYDTTGEMKTERREVICSVSYRKCARIGTRLLRVLLLCPDQKTALPLHRHPLCVSAVPLFCGAPFVSDLNLTLFHTQLGFSCCCYHKLQIRKSDSPSGKNCYCYSLGTQYCFRNWCLVPFSLGKP